MKKVDFGWKYYFQPTPKRLRVFGDSLAAAGSSAIVAWAVTALAFG